MITTTMTNASRTVQRSSEAAGKNYRIPGQRQERGSVVPISPDHLTEEARRRSESEQSAIDIAAGW